MEELKTLQQKEDELTQEHAKSRRHDLRPRSVGFAGEVDPIAHITAEEARRLNEIWPEGF